MTILSTQVMLAHDSPVHLLNKTDLSLDGKLNVSLRTAATFARDAQVEISSEDDSLHDKLSIADGSLVLQDRRTVLAQVDLRKTFGSSAFGPLRIRLVLHDGTAGDWMPLGVLVRVPTLSELHCPTAPDGSCTLVGSDLYLISAIAGDASFSSPTEVPDGFVGGTLTVPHPTEGTLYLRLRDDPTSASSVTMPPAAP
jgi:hypothetical protein